jgi:hypothetical protein
MMFFKKKTPPNISLAKKFGSLAFYISIPVLLVLNTLALVSLTGLLAALGFDKLAWGVFAQGFLLFSYFVSRDALSGLRTLLHELKHTVVVMLTGNKFKSISIGRHEGHVCYEAYRATLHLEPFVILAPYFWPLLSLPAFAACIASEFIVPQAYHLLFVYLLGSAAGIDITTSLREISPHQSDLKRIFGGFIATRSFIYLANFGWTGICLLWLAGGNKGLLFALYLCARAATEFAGQ